MSRNGARLFVDSELADDELTLDERLAHYAANVLRLAVGDGVTVFNGRGTERRATLDKLTRRGCSLRLHDAIDPLADSRIAITLIQGLIKPDRMDLIVQKATELGVTRIVAAKAEFSAVKLDAERAGRKLGHWQRIAESACEQSGRHAPPTIAWHRSIADAVAERPATEPKIAFHNGPNAGSRLPDAVGDAVTLVVGPEGGFSPTEIALLAGSCLLVPLGVRILRAETAAIVACGLAQARWGDLS